MLQFHINWIIVLNLHNKTLIFKLVTCNIMYIKSNYNKIAAPVLSG